LFSQLEINGIIAKDIKLESGLKVVVLPGADHRSVIIAKMDGAKRLALGLPLDINLAGFDELRLIPGIGNMTAINIMALREQLGRFEKLEQLMRVKGIKEKKLSKLRQYLYVDKMLL